MTKLLREVLLPKGTLYTLADENGNKQAFEANEAFIIKDVVEVDLPEQKSDLETELTEIQEEQQEQEDEQEEDFEEDVHERKKLSKEDFQRIAKQKIKDLPVGFKRQK